MPYLGKDIVDWLANVRSDCIARKSKNTERLRVLGARAYLRTPIHR